MCGKLATVSNEKTTKTEEQAGLLTSQEWEVCVKIAAGTPPHSQRALALLALDGGVTQAEAGERSGLTSGSVRYWRNRFRKRRLRIFPETLLGDVGKGSSLTRQEAPKEQALQTEPGESVHPAQPAVVGEKAEIDGESQQQDRAAEGEKRAGKAKGQAAGEGAKKTKKKRKEKRMAKRAKKPKSGKRQTKAKGGKKAKKRKKTAKKAKGGTGGAGADVGKARKKKP
jgi:hypothetical protein